MIEMFFPFLLQQTGLKCYNYIYLKTAGLQSQVLFYTKHDWKKYLSFETLQKRF